MAATEGILSSQVSPRFLHSNSTSHTWPFSAIAEIIDNAYDPDVYASMIWIDRRVIDCVDCLTFVDNGKGMEEDKLYKMLSFGYNEKVAVGNLKPIGYYGNGFQSGSMRLGKDTLVFTRCRASMSVGFLSQSYLQAVGAKAVIVPIVTWSLPAKSRVMNPASNNNLKAILEHSIFSTENQLINELDSLEKYRTGTNIIIYNLTKEKETQKFELDFDSDILDIRNPETHVVDSRTLDRPIHTASPEYRRSLREYCSILYLKPRMKIILRGNKVKTKLISKSLSKTETDVYRPTWLKKPVKIVFGFTSSREPESYGIMMYYKNRLIKAFERVGVQKQANEQGVGVVGVVEADFLEPIHNKQDFNNNEKYITFMQNVAIKLKDYWNEKTCGEIQNPQEQEQQLPEWTWAQCDNCLKWRRLPTGYCDRLPEMWYCKLNPDAAFNRCDIDEEPEDDRKALKVSYTKTYRKKQEKKKRQLKAEEERRMLEREQVLRNRQRRFKRQIEELDIKNQDLEFQLLMEKGAGTSSSTVTSRSTIATRKRKSDNPDCSDGKMFKTEDGGMVEVRQISNTSVTTNKDEIAENKADENTTYSIRPENRTEDNTGKENGEVKIESSKSEIKTSASPSASVDHQLDIKPDKALLVKKMKENDVPATNKGSQTVPVVMKLASPEETELLKLSAVEKNAMLLSKTRELKEVKGNLEEAKRNLTHLRENILRLLKTFDSDYDYGEPENVEKFILKFIKFNEEESQEASGS